MGSAVERDGAAAGAAAPNPVRNLSVRMAVGHEAEDLGEGWLPRGPEIALREPYGIAWIWVGDRVLLVRLVEVERIRLLRKWLR